MIFHKIYTDVAELSLSFGGIILIFNALSVVVHRNADKLNKTKELND